MSRPKLRTFRTNEDNLVTNLRARSGTPSDNEVLLNTKDYTAASFLELHQLFRAYRSHGGVGWLFRGHADTSWRLLPKAGRPPYDNGQDLGRFKAWRNQACAYTALPDSEWECLAVAQHHGLATRLLDWTLNPLAATYFAVIDEPQCDGMVICYFPPDGFIIPDEIALTDLRQVATYLPRAIHDRVVRQQGVFTVHPDPSSEIIPQELPPPLEGANLIRIMIPSRSKAEIGGILLDYGIHAASMFPDLEGLSRRVNWETAQWVAKRNARSNAK